MSKSATGRPVLDRVKAMETELSELSARVDRMAGLCRGCRATLVAVLLVMLSFGGWAVVARAMP